MQFPKGWRWAAFGGAVALIVISVGVAGPWLRAFLSILAIAPLIYITARTALQYERSLSQARRRYTKLRKATDDFIIAVRNLNRITVLSQDEDVPEDARVIQSEVVQHMHKLVDEIVEAAGQEDPFPEGAAPKE